MYRTVSDTWPDYQQVEDRENDVGARAVGVPGSLKGWCETLDRFGTFSLADVLQPAIRYAKHGFPATRYLSEIIHAVAADMRRFPETAKTFMPDGVPLAAGQRLRQGEFGDTLAALAQAGPNLLYGGALGRESVAYLASIDGLITAEDLAGYETVWDEPVFGDYRGYRIVGPPPPSAGGVQIVEMLNMLEDYDVAALGYGTVDGIHLLAEVMKIAFEDRKRHTGDPAFVDVPVERLTSKAYAAERRAEIDMARARPEVDVGHSESNHTTHLTVADEAGNIVSATHTIHSAFGSKVTVPGTGMILNNTMNIFDPHPGFANSIAPGKRMTSSMSPMIVLRDGTPCFALGLPGAVRIFPSAMQAIVNVIDHGMTPQEAVEAPRVWCQGQALEVEAAVPVDVRDGLTQRGQRVEAVRLIGGGMNMIAFDDLTLIGAACWRADGAPVGLGGGPARRGSRFDV